MPYCPSCGAQVDAAMRFCPSCGSALAETSAASVSTYAAAPAASAAAAQADYRVILISCGSCTKTTARELFRDILGYSAVEAKRLTDNAPIELARALTLDQAVSLARLFGEYGMQIAVCNANGYVDVNPHVSGSVFNAAGTLAGSVAATLATLTALNRVQHFLRWSYPAPGGYVFAPRYRYAVPPVYRPRPAPRPAPPPPPAPRPKAAAPRPAAPKAGPSTRPGGGRPGGGGGPKPSGGRGGGFGGRR